MSTGLPTLFISHSSAEDKLARKVIAALRERVRGTLDVLLDEDALEGGQRWRNELWQWWSECDAAIVVCSEAALKSDWVFLEVSVLMRRKAVNEHLPVLPLIIDPNTPGKVKKGIFGDQNLQEIQFTKFTTANFDATMDKLAAKLAALKALDRTNKPLLTFEDRLAAVLESAGSAALRQAAEKLETTAHDWAGVGVQARIVARAFLECKTLDQLCKALSALSPRLRGAVSEIVDLIAPSWLRRDEVAPVQGVVDRPAGSRGVALPSWLKEIAQWHVQRATRRLPPEGTAIEFLMPAGSAPVDETVQSIAKSVRERLNPLWMGDDDVVLRRLKKKEESREPVFVLVPVDANPQSSRIEARLLVEIMKRVNATFPTLGFFVLAGTAGASLADAKSSGRLVFVPYDHEREKQLNFDYAEALG